MLLTVSTVDCAWAQDRGSRPVLWQGLYLGIQGGYAGGSASFSAPVIEQSVTDGLTYGGFVGHNWQLSHLVLGVEVDAGIKSIETSARFGSAAFVNSSDWYASVRGRAGLAIGSALIYGTGGVATSRTATSLIDANRSLAANDLTPSFVYGAGVEFSMLNSMSLRFEALRFDNMNSALRPDWIGSTVKTDETMLRAGFSFRFN